MVAVIENFGVPVVNLTWQCWNHDITNEFVPEGLCFYCWKTFTL